MCPCKSILHPAKKVKKVRKNYLFVCFLEPNVNDYSQVTQIQAIANFTFKHGNLFMKFF